MSEKRCKLCDGTGLTLPAHDMLARPPKEAAEYERQRREAGQFTCPLCGGSGEHQPVEPVEQGE